MPTASPVLLHHHDDLVVAVTGTVALWFNALVVPATLAAAANAHGASVVMLGHVVFSLVG